MPGTKVLKQNKYNNKYLFIYKVSVSFYFHFIFRKIVNHVYLFIYKVSVSFGLSPET